jgi:TetR/AcrR family transcriptional regulator
LARSRAKDYDEKREAMLHRAATAFARDGYDRASMAGLAAECGVSKALLYHYYASKEALLSDIAYRDADAEHRVQIEALRLLPEVEQEELKALERRLVALFAEAIRALSPAAFEARPLLKPVTMALFGMLNWFYMWFREGGTISREGYATLATDMLVAGVRELARRPAAI